jgi:c-di-GMP-binding flagellar brake protein YcgR
MALSDIRSMTSSVVEQERRGSKRFHLDWPVCLWHEGTKRFYSGRSVNISATGALIHLPLSVPIRSSEQVEVNFSVPMDQRNAKHSKVFSANVVRVNRGASLLDGRQAVAVEFA